MQKPISPRIVALTFGVLVLSFLAVFYAVAWQEPASSPPQGNVDTPLNVGSTGQVKKGNLVLNSEGTYPTGLTVNRDVDILNGNVGIGTATPGEALHVMRTAANTDARIQIEGTGDVNAAGLELVDRDNSKEWEITTRANSNDNLWFSGYNGSAWNTAMVISQTTGDVGIGNPSPATKLDVNGTIKSSGFQMTTGAGADKILTSDDSGAASWRMPTGIPVSGGLYGTCTQTSQNRGLPCAVSGCAQISVPACGSARAPAFCQAQSWDADALCHSYCGLGGFGTIDFFACSCPGGYTPVMTGVGTNINTGFYSCYKN